MNASLRAEGACARARLDRAAITEAASRGGVGGRADPGFWMRPLITSPAGKTPEMMEIFVVGGQSDGWRCGWRRRTRMEVWVKEKNEDGGVDGGEE